MGTSLSGQDARIALVIETEARLDGIRQARQAAADLAAQVTSGNLQSAAAQQQVATQVNQLIGAFTAQARAVDDAGTTTVNAFRREGDALSVYLSQLGATDQQINRIGASVQALEQKTGAGLFSPQATAQAAQAAASIERVNPAARQTALAVSRLAFTFEGMGGSAQGAVRAMGLLGTSIAATSESASVAAAASGIGALLIVLSTLFALMEENKNAFKPTQEFLDHLQNLKLSGAKQELADIQTQMNKVTAEAAKSSGVFAFWEGIFNRPRTEDSWFKQLVVDLKLLTGLTTVAEQQLGKLDEQRQAAAKRLGGLDKKRFEEQQQHSLQLRQSFEKEIQADIARRNAQADPSTSYDRQIAETIQATIKAVDDINRRYTLTNKQKQEGLVITSAERDQQRQLVDYANQVSAAIQGRLIREREIAREKANTAGIGTLGSLTGDPELIRVAAIQKAWEVQQESYRTGLESRQLADEIYHATLRKLETDAVNNGIHALDRSTQAWTKYHGFIGAIAKGISDALRRYQIFAQAKKDQQSALSEFAAGSASAAALDPLGAALHYVAAGAFQAAAAFGFAEAAVGGGGGGGGGGSAGGSANQGTFVSNETKSQGGQTIIFQTVDPSSREVIAQTTYDLERAGILNKPVYANIPPTTGVTVGLR